MIQPTRRSKFWKQNGQLIFTLLGVIFGIIIGLILRFTKPDVKTISYVNFPGEILMNALKMMILPLISASLISGLAQLDPKHSGRIGAWAFTYYAITTCSAVILGIILVLIIHPGNPSVKGFHHTTNTKSDVSGVDKFLDVVRNIFPDNIIEASFRQISSDFVPTNESDPTTLDIHIHKVDGMNVLGIIVFCTAVGVAVSFLGERGKPITDFFIALDHVINLLVNIVMWYAPIGIASLIAAKIMAIGDLGQTLQSLSLYMLTVIIGLIIHLFGTIPLIYFIVSRKNPYKFMKGLLQAAMTALGTASSAASLPVTFKCLEINNKIDPAYTKFVLPVGAMVNMDGTALYEAVASIFIAQINGISLSLSQVVTVSITATLASIGAASIPSAGLVTMLIVLSAVGLPVDDISIIIAVDWFLDRLRTCVNVCGDGFGCGFVQIMCQKKSSKTNKISPKTSEENGITMNSLLNRQQQNAETSIHISFQD